MQKKMADWFFMRPGFDTFLLQPEKHARYLFGKKDREKRDLLLEGLVEASYSTEGFKAAVYGDFGRGKTHQSHNLIIEIRRRSLPYLPMYVRCGAYKKKEPFNSLFRELIFGHSSEEMNEVATEYQRRVNAGEEQPIVDVVRSEDIANVMAKGLTAPNIEAVKISMRWLAGDPKIDLTMLGGSLKPQIVGSGDFADVLKGLAHMFIRVRNAVPLYVVDEAERFQNVTDTDSYYTWLQSLREITEVHDVALIFMIGAKTRDFLPVIFVQDEIVRRIGVSNYIEFMNPGLEEIREFLNEQFQTSIRKGPVPDVQKDVVDPAALDDEIPVDLREIVGDDPERLRSFPLEPEALEEFVNQLASGELANKPSEMQKRLQKAAQKAMHRGSRTIGADIVEEVAGAF